MQNLLFTLDQLCRIHVTRIFFTIFLLFNAQNIRRPLHASQQVLTIIRFKKFRQRFNTPHHHQQIILPTKREHGINQIMPCALVFEIDFQTITEEGEEVTKNYATRFLNT